MFKAGSTCAPFSCADAPVAIVDPDVAPAIEVNDTTAALRIEAQKQIDMIAGLTSHLESVLGADGTGALSLNADAAPLESDSEKEKDMDACVDKDIVAAETIETQKCCFCCAKLVMFFRGGACTVFGLTSAMASC